METLHHGHETSKRQRRAKAIADARAMLAQKFPEAFKGRGEPKHPLAIGIHKQIMERMPGMSEHLLHRALRDYTTGPLYLKMVVEGATRIDITGRVVTRVTEAQAAHAAATLKRLEAKFAEQRERSIERRRDHHPELRA